MHLILTDILHHSQQAIKTAWKFVDTNLENRGGEGGGGRKKIFIQCSSSEMLGIGGRLRLVMLSVGLESCYLALIPSTQFLPQAVSVEYTILP